MATVTSKGQVTLPKAVRDALGLKAGSQVRFDFEDGRVILRKEIQLAAIHRWRGYLRPRYAGARTAEIMAELRDE